MAISTAPRSIPNTTVVTPGFAGAVGAGLSLGIAELLAGLFGSVPSAVSSVGAFVVANTPAFVEQFAIRVFGIADKGALALGTAIIAVLVGAYAGRLAVRRRSVLVVAFGLFAILGIAAGVTQPDVAAVPTVIAIGVAGLTGWRVTDKFIYPGAEAPDDALADDAARRRFLKGVAGAGVAVASGALGRNLIIDRSETVREGVLLPQAASTVSPVGPTNQFSSPPITPIVVPNDQFYRIDTALIVPRPDPASWVLRVGGMVDTPLEMSLDDLMKMDQHEQYVTIACVSNKVGGDLVGNAKWTGVRLVDVLEMAGVQPAASQLVGRSVDGWTAGFPTELAFDGRDPLIVIGMNDAPLPPRHGFPARLIVPGLYGYVSATKWIEEIELTTWDAFDAYWIPRGWSKLGPIKTQSRIDYPTRGGRIGGSPAVIAGVAWASRSGISMVEVQIDGGEWHQAELSEPLSGDAWVQWRVEVPLGADAGYEATVRATDGAGATQTPIRMSARPDGATGHHTVRFFTI